MAKLISITDRQFIVSSKVVAFFIEDKTNLVIWHEGGFITKNTYSSEDLCKKDCDALAKLMREDLNPQNNNNNKTNQTEV